MAQQSRMLALGTAAPGFVLPDAVSGRTIGLEDFASSPALLVTFICNHASRPGGKIPVTGADLRAAATALLTNRPIAAEQIPSIGCSLKWKAGQEPDWG